MTYVDYNLRNVDVAWRVSKMGDLGILPKIKEYDTHYNEWGMCVFL